MLSSDQPPSPVVAKPHPRQGKSQWFFRIEPSEEERERFLEQLAVYFAALYPGCPAEDRAYMVAHAREKGHYGRLAEIAGVLATNSIRHRATPYDALMRLNMRGEGLTRDEARKAVARDVENIVTEWGQGSAEDDPGYGELRRVYRKRWQKYGRKKPRPGLTANENAALTEYLRGWLERQALVDGRGLQVSAQASEGAHPDDPQTIASHGSSDRPPTELDR